MKFNKQILEAVNKGILLALDNYQDNEQISSSFNVSDVINTEDVIKNKIDVMKNFVNLGLPSGTLWCKYNLGANTNKLESDKDWYGNYYAFGELTPKKYKYKFKKDYQAFFGESHRYIKYNMSDKLMLLELCDDAAYNSNLNKKYYRKYGINICTPTINLYEELLDNTTLSFLNDYKNIPNLNVCIFKSNINGNELVFPLHGYLRSTGSSSLEITNPNAGYYMSSYIAPTHLDWLYYAAQIENIKDKVFNHTKIRVDTIARENGTFIRPVLMK